MTIYSHYTTNPPPVELALNLNIILDITKLNLQDYNYIYNQLDHFIVDFEKVDGFLNKHINLKKKNKAKVCNCGSILKDNINKLYNSKCSQCAIMISQWYCAGLNMFLSNKCKNTLCCYCYSMYNKKNNSNISLDNTISLNNKFGINKNNKKFIPKKLL